MSMNDNKMVEDVSVDQIKHSNAFDLKLPERSIDTTLIIGLSAAICLILSALVLTGSLCILQHTCHFISFSWNVFGNNDFF